MKLFATKNTEQQHTTTDEGEVIRMLPTSEEWEQIGPVEAEVYLKNNENNRRISAARVEQFASDLRAGRWVEYHPHGIALDWNGRIIDGQHRLVAVIAAGVSVWMRVTRGLPPDMDRVFDLGSPRSGAELMRRSGVTQPFVKSAIISLLYVYDNFPSRVWTANMYPSKTFMFNFQKENSDMIHSACNEGVQAAQRANMPQTQYGVAYILAHRALLHIEWNDFHKGVITGVDLRLGDPRLALRNYFQHQQRSKEGHDSWNRQKRLGQVIKAFNAFVEGDSLKMLKFERQHLPMPTIG